MNSNITLTQALCDEVFMKAKRQFLSLMKESGETKLSLFIMSSKEAVELLYHYGEFQTKARSLGLLAPDIADNIIIREKD